ncbi:MAG: hypothetical protein IH628_04145 [Proteobacteria bacterium]|nr:hypothetical protein [Pseudomonadota bacterium]
MKRVFGTALAMALACMLALGALGVGFYHLEVARAEEALAAFDAARTDGIYVRLEKALEIGSRIPWVFDAVRADLRVRRMRLSYWRRDYAAILRERAAQGEDAKTLGPPLRFIRANARYRAITMAQARERIIRDLGESIDDYAKIVEADPTFTDAAHNYEFLLMLRNDMVNGKRPALLKHLGGQDSPEPMKGAQGEQGAKQGVKVPQRKKVLVPKEGDEDPEKRGPEPGKGSATKKRG